MSDTLQTGPARLDALLNGPGLVVAPGVFDGFSARAVELSGYSAAYVTGAGSSLSNFGLPDVGLITQSDMVDHIFRLSEATTLPLIVDGDTGFGSAANVVRTVRRYERAGAAAIQLEDQVFPKRCGHLEGKEVLETDQFAARIAAACDARDDDRFKIIARTDAIQPHGLDDALDRANRYAAAGADLVFVEAPQDVQQVERIARDVAAPKMINMISASVTPLLTFAQLETYGFSLAIYPMVTMASGDGRHDPRVAGASRRPGRPIRRPPPEPPRAVRAVRPRGVARHRRARHLAGRADLLEPGSEECFEDLRLLVRECVSGRLDRRVTRPAVVVHQLPLGAIADEGVAASGQDDRRLVVGRSGLRARVELPIAGDAFEALGVEPSEHRSDGVEEAARRCGCLDDEVLAELRFLFGRQLDAEIVCCLGDLDRTTLIRFGVWCCVGHQRTDQRESGDLRAVDDA